MAVTDPLGDLLTRIRNGQRAKKDSVLSPASKLRLRVLDVLQREGYIRGYSDEQMGPAAGVRIELNYTLEDGGISVQPANDTKRARAFWGMQRTMVQNLVTGVTDGFTKKLLITGASR
ncbi:hypothetical protein WR25_04850 [Diploscapter pachys]|uniref:30S ribosomal protein S8 n=1 Tax=Diploscapter pachys TaxID=2018661 RepID=A0A2A2KBJ2_9BILA|nr:hypothetical protein WR25_04850 [Diploscapter pachys]